MIGEMLPENRKKGPEINYDAIPERVRRVNRMLQSIAELSVEQEKEPDLAYREWVKGERKRNPHFLKVGGFFHVLMMRFGFCDREGAQELYTELKDSER